MIINIPVDIAYAFDFLTILSVKKFFTDDFNKKIDLSKEITNLQMVINNQIGYDLAKKIYNSAEYKKLFDINVKLFGMINLAKKDIIKASELDNENYNRFLAKKELQNKFFGEDVTEQKIGYDYPYK